MVPFLDQHFVKHAPIGEFCQLITVCQSFDGEFVSERFRNRGGDFAAGVIGGPNKNEGEAGDTDIDGFRGDKDLGSNRDDQGDEVKRKGILYDCE